MSRNRIAFSPAKSPKAVGPYNHAVKANGFLFSAGQIPLDPDTDELVSGDITSQTDQVLKNIRTILEHEALSFTDVIKTTVFLQNLGDFAAMNEVYSRYFPEDFPARSTIQVAALPKGALVEIEFVACFPAQ